MLAIANMADSSRNAGHQEEFGRHFEPLHIGKCGLRCGFAVHLCSSGIGVKLDIRSK